MIKKDYMPTLTKSKYLTGLQCDKLLWVTLNDPGRIPPVDPGTQYVFNQGHEVCDLAKKLYPGGIDIPYNNFKDSIARTQELMGQRKPLFEASILAGNLYVRVDILNPADGDAGAWDIIEVKSSSRVKDVNVLDVAFQRYCCEQMGLTIRRCYLGHINTAYVRDGEVDPQALFTVEDISAHVDAAIGEVPAAVEAIFRASKLKECPDVDIGLHCTDPYDCSLKDLCWTFLPDHSVFSLYWLGKEKKFDLLERGIASICKIPEDYELSEKQRIQKACIEKDDVYLDKAGIKDFLATLKYPLYYLDFETFNPAVPLFDGMRPYQKIAFQFSLHVVKREGAAAEHHSFLADGQGDPRPGFLSALKAAIGTEGSVVAYNAGFEKGVLDELAVAFPQNAAWIDDVVRRVEDLLVPFKAFHYYHPGQNGSASLKRILPAVTGEGYEGMNISDGGAASLIYEENIFGSEAPDEEKAKIRKDLEDYCCLDTQAMVDIVGKLRELS